MTFFRSKDRTTRIWRAALLAVGMAAALALLAYAYLGIFTRYLADDYCHADLLQTGNVIDVSIQKYLHSSNRYANVLLFGLSEAFGPMGVAILPPAMVVLWGIGLTWMLKQLKEIAHFDWPSSLGFTIATLVAFFTILQAPNRYQSIYWRSGLVTYFAPLVFIVYLAGFMLSQVRRARAGRMPVWASLIAFVSAFLIGGLAETTDALHIVMLILALVGVWLWVRDGYRRPALVILSAALAGALLAMLTMFLSPANALRLSTGTPDLAVLMIRFVKFPLDFIWDTFKTLPLPSFVSVAIPFLAFYGLYADSPALEKEDRSHVWLAIVLLPLVMYALIAASFAPSAYGQSYPVERARFPARFVMTGALALEGALLAILVSQTRLTARFSAALVASVLLGLSALYPLRAAWQAYQT
ncbi:MAG: hypothetical protein GXP40_00820, partial [Chloroflexi bacterium]|nr:hypothetical protein [Chloroflexota bacterium]